MCIIYISRKGKLQSTNLVKFNWLPNRYKVYFHKPPLGLRGYKEEGVNTIYYVFDHMLKTLFIYKKLEGIFSFSNYM
jgi:hypothetical protein